MEVPKIIENDFGPFLPWYAAQTMWPNMEYPKLLVIIWFSWKYPPSGSFLGTHLKGSSLKEKIHNDPKHIAKYLNSPL